MVRYRYALDSDSVVDAITLPDTQSPRGKRFACLGCGGTLVARFRGVHQRPHFSHESESACALESYLHKLAKLKFLELFRLCCGSGRPLIIELPTEKRCGLYQAITGRHCSLAIATSQINIAEFFDSAVLEGQVNGYRADVLLQSKTKGVPHVLVEFAVTHQCEPAKLQYAGRIVEVPIRSEEDIESFVVSGVFNTTNAKFWGFHPKRLKASAQECLCHEKTGALFRVYKSGLAHLKRGSYSELIEWRKTLNNTLWHRLVSEDPDDGLLTGKHIFESCLHEAADAGIAVRNCILCRYVGDPNFFSDKPAFCKWKKVHVDTGEAASCEAFRLPRK